MTVSSVLQVKQAEQLAIDGGVTENELIERASQVFCLLTQKFFTVDKRVLIFCGGGNNGADGLSIALNLAQKNIPLTVFVLANKVNEYVLSRMNALTKLGVTIHRELKQVKGDIVIDALIGTGLISAVSEQKAEIINFINSLNLPIISVDVPSGLNADTGEIPSVSVIANYTVTFGAIKQGLIIANGRNVTGELIFGDIGLQVEPLAKIITKDTVKLPLRKTVSHKYDYGFVKIIAGSREMSGASIMAQNSAQAVLRSGAGLCCLCVPKSMASEYALITAENTLAFLPDIDGKIVFDKSSADSVMQKADCILIGPGLAPNQDVKKYVTYIAKNFSGTLVIDASGLRAIQDDVTVIANQKAKIVLTPHLGEFSGISEKLVDINLPLTTRVKTLAKTLGCVIVAKSATTVISDGHSIYLNVCGTPALAKGGSGDVLAGIISAFAKRLSPLSSAIKGCYVLGQASLRAEEQFGTEGVLATDVIKRLWK